MPAVVAVVVAFPIVTAGIEGQAGKTGAGTKHMVIKMRCRRGRY